MGTGRAGANLYILRRNSHTAQHNYVLVGLTAKSILYLLFLRDLGGSQSFPS